MWLYDLLCIVNSCTTVRTNCTAQNRYYVIDSRDQLVTLRARARPRRTASDTTAYRWSQALQLLALQITVDAARSGAMSKSARVCHSGAAV